jgi:3-deoxy-D-manno-octulosonate 8-phosphate phosphatase KdsC-like HAD superfamily phosphatase
MNAPLITLCIRLLKSNIKAFVKGKDIGLNLINMLKKTKKSKVADSLTILWNERTKLVEKLVRKGMNQTDAENCNFIVTYMDKVEAIENYISKNNLTWKDSWYIGNDVNDLGAIRKAKFSICPSDAVKAVKKEVDLKLKTKGGYGVLSELVTLIES